MDLVSLMSNNVFFTFVGFEERFCFGFMRILDVQNPKRVVFLKSSEHDERSLQNLQFLTRVLELRKIPFDEIEIKLNDYKSSMTLLYDAVSAIDFNFESCLVDITTMPRDYVLIIFNIIEQKSGVVNYVYNDPGYYDHGWLQKEYFPPSPVVGFSGVHELGRETCSIVITGFDTHCTSHIVDSVEAKLTHLAVQNGDKFDNNKRNFESHKLIYDSNRSVHFFRVDAFSYDHGLREIENIVKSEIDEKNIVISAIGPKLSLVALFRLQRKYPEICINHIVSSRVNRNYSTGVGRTYYGKYISGTTSPLDFAWIPGARVDEDLLSSCATLFTGHYGVWSASGPRPGSPVVMSLSLIKKYLEEGDNWIATASYGGALVAYAICRRFETDKGKISWITQLVVHNEYRNQGVATQILNSIWGFSDHYAWGLATSSPYAVRALEKATRRRVVPEVVKDKLSLLKKCLESIFYLRDRDYDVFGKSSIVHSDYHVDHSHVISQIADVSCNVEWVLGDLPETSEWLAVTFREQNQFKLSRHELSYLFANSDSTVVNAYQKMKIDENHAWTKHTKQEVDFIMSELGVKPGDHVLDFGAGFGRHTIELAQRGVEVTSVDFVPAFFENLNHQIIQYGLDKVHNCLDDCRTVKLNNKFDYAICLYDVIGSFPDELDNNYIIQNLADHLNHDAKVLISTMNLVMSENIAKNRESVFSNPDLLLDLPPSNTMESSGNIFNPDYYLFDKTHAIFYRKEQFESGVGLPCELIVRDKRYDHVMLETMCKRCGLTPVWHRYVQLGHWESSLDPKDINAKEVLILCSKG